MTNEPAPLLVAGFEPFGGAPVNPSGAAARRLHGEAIAGRRVFGLELPCVFGAAPTALWQAIDTHRPMLVLALGLAPSRRGFFPERVAINLDDARIPDNAGAQPLDRPVLAAAPPAYFSPLPVKAMAAALRAEGWAAEVSHSAGTFVCNHLFFHLLHGAAGRDGLRGGFMHVGADLDVAQVARGVRCALAAALSPSPGTASGGSID